MNDRKVQIIDAAIRLFAAEGLAVPTAKIARESGSSNGTLFNYFPSKQVLIDAVYLSIKEEIAAHVLHKVDPSIGIEDLLRHVWETYTRWAMNRPLRQRVGILLKMSNMISEEAAKSSDEIFSLLKFKLKAATKSGLIKKVASSFLNDITGAHLLATISFAETKALSGKKLDQHIANSFAIFWDGIKR